MKSGRTSGFWTKGKESYREQVDKEESEALAPLKEELEKADEPSTKQRILDSIRSIKERYRKKRKDADESLFLNSSR